MGQLPITNGFYISDSLPISHQQCTNFFPSTVQTQGLAPEVLLGIPGLIQLATSGTVAEENRGSWVKNGVPYFVNGSKLYVLNRAVDAAGVETFTLGELGTIAGTGRVWMSSNDTQLLILVPGGKGYIYNENAGTPFLEITDADFTANGNPLTVRFVDGYFLLTTDEKKVIVSALNNGMLYDALDFASAESDPDEIVASVVAGNQVYVLGSITTEGFQNIGGSGFPFQRNNVFLDKGCVAPFAIVNTNQTFIMIGAGKDESPAIWRFTGNNYRKISTVAIDKLLAEASDTELAEAFAWYYATKGAFFAGFNFSGRTVVFDLATEKWHERKSTVLDTQDAWRVSSLVSAYGRTLVGDRVDGRIGSLESDVYTEYDEEIIRVFTTQPFADREGFMIPVLELTMEAGVGNAAVPDPEVSLAISTDAKTFSMERTRKIGKLGVYKQRTIWNRNGRIPRYGVLLFRLSDPVKAVVIKLEAS